MAAGEVDAGNLQIAPIDVALVERDAAIDAHLLVRAAAHRIVGAFHHSAGVSIEAPRESIIIPSMARACMRQVMWLFGLCL